MPGVYQFSQTANLNSSAVPSIDWSEGMPPSGVNNAARAEMAAVACWRDDISGSILTSGTSAAYQITSNQGFDTLAHLNGQMIAFVPHVTSVAGPVTLTLDGFANLPLRSSPGKELLAGTLVAGTPYICTYNNTDASLYLQSFYGASPYLVPLGAMLEFTGTTAPNSSFALPFGQAISRTTYAAYFAMVGTQYGPGDGSTTFNIIDVRGRVVASPDNMGGIAAGRLTNIASTLGSNGGEQAHPLVAGEIPTITSTGSISGTAAGSNIPQTSSPPTQAFDNVSGSTEPTKPLSSGLWNFVNSLSVSGSATVASNNTGGGAHNNVQPTIVANRILRII
jgi:microcystin-dependent protein